MRSGKYPIIRLGLVIAIVFSTGCAGTGIRKLNQVEQDYFVNLEKATKASEKKLASLLELTQSNEEQALRQAAQLRSDIRRAKMVYSIREVLTAPQNNSAAFIQVTRNKVLLYHLAEAAKAEDQVIAAELALGKAQRSQLISSTRELSNLVAAAVASNKLLHNHLNKSGDAQLADVIAEVGRQVSAFNEKIQEADQQNPAIQKLVAAGKTAEWNVDKADEGLSKFIEVWSKLNKGTR